MRRSDFDVAPVRSPGERLLPACPACYGPAMDAREQVRGLFAGSLQAGVEGFLAIQRERVARRLRPSRDATVAEPAA